MIALLVWRPNITLFSSNMPPVRSFQEATHAHEESGNVAQKEGSCFCYVPTVWLAVKMLKQGGHLTVILPSFLT